jgi:formiminoglutamase
MTLSHDPRWPRGITAGRVAAASRSRIETSRRATLLGIPTPRTSLSTTQAHLTPAAVRAALQRYSLETPLLVTDAGDLPDPDLDEAAATAAIAALDTDLLIALGGDNAATVPTALGRWGSAIASAGLVTVDAHHDLRDGVSNGSPVRRLLEAGLDGHRVVQVGIEPFANSREYAARAAGAGITVVLRDALRRRPMSDVMDEALELAASGGGPVHVDLDVDVCDRAVAPACPASVPGGLSAMELREAARAAGGHATVTSVDLVEVDAAADAPDGRTVRLVALCVLEVVRARGDLIAGRS